MTISNTASHATYTGNGSQQIFDVKNGSEGIYFDAASELYVTVRVDDTVTVKSIGTHYTVAGAGTDTGTITFLTAPASGAEVRIERRTPLTPEGAAEAAGAPDGIVQVIDNPTMAVIEAVMRSDKIDLIQSDDLKRVAATYLTVQNRTVIDRRPAAAQKPAGGSK